MREEYFRSYRHQKMLGSFMVNQKDMCQGLLPNIQPKFLMNLQHQVGSFPILLNQHSQKSTIPLPSNMQGWKHEFG